jgi:coniferyl-aldehyde dehydrogenase
MPNASPAAPDLNELLHRQQQAFAAQPYPSPDERRNTLKRLRAAIRRDAQALAAAAAEDFSARPEIETLMLDVTPSVLHINHLLRHLGRWMKRSRRSVEWLFLTNRAYVTYQPKGVVGILVPWNFPIYLALGPLATALAAGNRCMIKMSEHAPATSRAVKQLITSCFDEDEVAVIEGGPDVARAFTGLPFNHIVFTGSPEIGKHVMRAAADNLTPVTLELGGKSPAIVSSSADIDVAARRVAHGKTTNAGQICVAPDYALVPEGSAEQFAAAVIDAANRFGDAGSGTGMIHGVALNRQLSLIDDAQSKGARVLVARVQPRNGRVMPLHVVLGITDDMRLSREEIFGPILPVITYKDFSETIAHVNRDERPLALYYFGHSNAEREALLKQTHSGGITFNDWGWHVVNHDLPFGGIGNSGMGNYHGEEGFRELSHAKSVFAEHRWFPSELFHPPYGGWLQRTALRLMTGLKG